MTLIALKANKLFFIDCGEVIDVAGEQLEMFSLSDRAQKTSAKAIPCTVLEVTFFSRLHWPRHDT